MTGCCVPNCSNATEKGFSLKCFPSNLQQRTIWRQNINNHSSKWILTKNSYVCEVHFSEEMWEKIRVDGKKKLKGNATPTIFPSKNSTNISAIGRNEHIQEKCTTQSILEIPSTSSKRLLEDIEATTLYNRAVSSALQFIGEERHRSEYKVTALFIEIVSKWFNIITSRFSSISLGKIEGQEESQRKFDQSVEFLKSVIDLFHNIKIGQDGKFKPVQCGIMITTTSFIELTNYLINNRGYSYVLGARFTQDCIENLFSNIRKKFPVPNALQFKQCLKIHSVSQYLQVLENTNYEQDEGAFVVNFFKPKSRKKKDWNTSYEIPVIPSHIDNKQIHMDNVNLNVLYSVAGYVIHKLSKLPTVCESCINSAGSRTFDANIKYSNLVHLRCFKSKTLFFVNTATYNYFHDMEIIIRRYLPYMKNINYDLVTFFTARMANLRCDTSETCCNLFDKIMKRFIMFRIKIDCKKGRLNTKIYNSKTMSLKACFY